MMFYLVPLLLACLGLGSKGSSLERVSIVPECPTGSRLSGYRLFTRSTRKDGECIFPNKVSIGESAFDPNKTGIVIFAHGFLGAGWNWYSWDMKDALLDKEDKNFIILDWSKGSVDWLPDVVESTGIVAEEVASLLRIFINGFQVDPKDIHLIGHSMGGRVMRLVGKQMSPMLGRITGLDPVPEHYKGVAHFTDVIHTTFIAGWTVADANFWPNNLDLGGLIPWVSPHMYAIYIYTESLKRCAFTAFQCDSWQDFLDTKCFDNPTNRMGHYATPSGGKGKLYLRILKEPPFC